MDDAPISLCALRLTTARLISFWRATHVLGVTPPSGIARRTTNPSGVGVLAPPLRRPVRWLSPTTIGTALVLLLAIVLILVKSGVIFYCTQRGNYKSVEIQLNAESREWIRQVIRTIDNAIQQGTLPAAPRKYACRICDYQTVCGPLEERRLEGKQTRLDALEDLRCLP